MKEDHERRTMRELEKQNASEPQRACVVTMKSARERVIVGGAGAPDRMEARRVDPQLIFGAISCRQLEALGLSIVAVNQLALLAHYVKRTTAAAQREQRPCSSREAITGLIKAIEALESAMARRREGLDRLKHEVQVGLGIGLATLKAEELAALKSETGTKQRQNLAARLTFKISVVGHIVSALQGEKIAFTGSSKGGGTKKPFEVVCDLVFKACDLSTGSAAAIDKHLARRVGTPARRVKPPADNTSKQASSKDELTRLWNQT